MKIGIIGLGLIGGSLACALKKAEKYKIYCYNRNLEVAEKAKRSGCVDEYFLSPEALVDKSDIVVLATTLFSYKDVIPKIKNYLDGKILTDIGSVKEKPSLEILEFLKHKESFVPAHPIAGKENSGFDNACPDLFQNKKTILTPFDFTDKKNISAVAKLWHDARASTEILDPKLHDNIYASVSHFVQMVSFATRDHIKPTGFTSEFCRLQNSPDKMWQEIFFYNQENLKNIFQDFQENLSEYISHKNRFIDKFSDIDPNDFAAYIISNIIYNITQKEHLKYAGSGFKSATGLAQEFNNLKACSKVLEESYNIIRMVSDEIKNSYLSRNV